MILAHSTLGIDNYIQYEVAFTRIFAAVLTSYNPLKKVPPCKGHHDDDCKQCERQYSAQLSYAAGIDHDTFLEVTHEPNDPSIQSLCLSLPPRFSGSIRQSLFFLILLTFSKNLICRKTKALSRQNNIISTY